MQQNLERWLCLQLLFGQLLLGLLGLVVVVPFLLISVVTEGRCLLYMSAKDMSPSSIPCNYIVVVTVVSQLVYSIFRSVFILLRLLNVIRINMQSVRTMVIVCFLVDLLFLLLVLAAAGVLSSGFSKFCQFIDSMNSFRCGDEFPFPAHTEIRWDRHYYHRLSMAEVGAWISWLVWMLQAALDILYFFANDLKVPDFRLAAPRSVSHVYEQVRSSLRKNHTSQ